MRSTLRCLALSLLGVSLLARPSAAQIATVWTRRYDGPAHNNDQPSGVAVDLNGNVVVTGVSWGGSTTKDDLATVKYAANGTRLWAKRYDGPGNSQEKSCGVAFDHNGNALVLGRSWAGSGFYNDYALLKYSVNGSLLWVANDDGLADLIDIPLSIAVDGAGNTYVAGTSTDVNRVRTEIVVMKFSPNGARLWLSNFAGPLPQGSYVAYAICTDAAGNTTVTGERTDATAVSQIATVRFDTHGTEVWSSMYEAATGGASRGNSVAIDSKGNALVVGYLGHGSGVGDYGTLKYDTNGNLLWAKSYNGPANGDDSASSVAVDSSDNVIVTGASAGTATAHDYATIKYSPNGKKLWLKRFDGATHGDDLAMFVGVDGSGNVAVTGRSTGVSTQFDFVTIGYSPSGSKLWSKKYNGPLDNDDIPSGLAIDSMGAVIVAGSSYGANGYNDYATIKY